MAVAVVARQAAPHVLQRPLGEDGDAVIGLLAVDLDIVAAVLEFGRREFLIDAFDFLQAGDVGLGFLQPFDQARQAAIRTYARLVQYTWAFQSRRSPLMWM